MTMMSLFDLPMPIPPIQSQIPRLGLSEIKSPSQRKAWNAEALEVLRAAQRDKRWPQGDELEVIARYSGTGGIGDSLNEYFTPPEIARVMWDILKAWGISGKALEPSCGIGVLLQDAPATFTSMQSRLAAYPPASPKPSFATAIP